MDTPNNNLQPDESSLERDCYRIEQALSLPRAELLRLLCRLYDANEDLEKSRVVNRFKSLQKVDLPSGPRSTKGQKKEYTFLQVCEVVLCFEMAQFGIDAWLLKKSFYFGEHLKLAGFVDDLATVIIGVLNDRSFKKQSFSMFSMDLLNIGGKSLVRPNLGEILLQRGICLLDMNLLARDILISFPSERLIKAISPHEDLSFLRTLTLQPITI